MDDARVYVKGRTFEISECQQNVENKAFDSTVVR